ncbi:MAG: hypothetical protein GXO31_04755 [Epsilonproteobacteria bacterium]|nr:hypothetical protein [Campylobacterota bacterium]
MHHKHHEKLEQVKEAVKNSPDIEELKKSLILEKIEEWKHEKEAFELIPKKLAELEEKLEPILKEIGLL